MDISREDRAHLIRDKYHGDASADLAGDLARLAAGEPLAYVIGWIPFLGLHILLDSHPLIPRPETEWWTELLIAHVRERFGDQPFTMLDLCAGSGAIGLAVLHSCPNATVYFGELSEAHCALIERTMAANGLDATRAVIRNGDLFEPFEERFDIIATNPPYIPSSRTLDASVLNFEPSEALFGGEDGTDLIARIAQDAPAHIHGGGELWIECDLTHALKTSSLVLAGGAQKADIRTDLYGRERLVLAYY